MGGRYALWSEEARAELIRLWALPEWTLPALAKKFCCSVGTIVRYRKALNLPQRGKGHGGGRPVLKKRAPVTSFAERRQPPPVCFPVHPTITGRLCGDPLPGRSALDQKKEK